MAELAGTAAVTQACLAAAERLRKQGAAALYQEGLKIQRTSMERTPVDTGALRASHVTEQPVIDGMNISVRIVVGGPAAEYALKVHEDLSAHHETGQAKYLESAYNEAVSGLGERLAEKLKL